VAWQEEVTMPLEPSEEELVKMYELHDELGTGAVFAYVRDLVLEEAAKQMRDIATDCGLSMLVGDDLARALRAMKGDGK
jgi:hypothetical protein